jgi:hypothetical protein
LAFGFPFGFSLFGDSKLTVAQGRRWQWGWAGWQ